MLHIKQYRLVISGRDQRRRIVEREGTSHQVRLLDNAPCSKLRLDLLDVVDALIGGVKFAIMGHAVATAETIAKGLPVDPMKHVFRRLHHRSGVVATTGEVTCIPRGE